MGRAIDIIKLIEWTYAEQCAHKADQIGGRLDSPMHVASQMDALAGIAALGCMVDGEGTPDSQLRGWDVHPDAERVHDAVLGLDAPRAAEMLMMHGILRNQPDPLAEERVYVDPRALNNEMRIAMIWNDPINRCDPLACRVPWLGGDFDLINEARVDYSIWRTALDVLVERLQGGLTIFDVTASTLPLEPWNQAMMHLAPVSDTRNTAGFRQI